jgi:hypothetical protein
LRAAGQTGDLASRKARLTREKSLKKFSFVTADI